MGFSLINMKLSTLGIFLTALALVLSFIFLVPAETKNSLVAPDGPLYILTRASDLFKNHQTLVGEKSILLVEMATSSNTEKTELLFEEYERYHGFYTDSLSENTNKEEMLDFIMNQATYFLQNIEDCPEQTRSFLMNALTLNLDKRARLLAILTNDSSTTGRTIEENTREIIMENTPEDIKNDVWEYMQAVKNN